MDVMGLMKNSIDGLLLILEICHAVRWWLLEPPLTEELYGKYIRDEYCKNYAVNIRNRFKNDAKHIVVMNY